MIPANNNYTIQSYKSERLFHRHSNLINNKIYSHYIPRIIIGISIFYLCILLIAYIVKRCRRHREKLEQREKDRLKLIWQKSMIELHLKKHRSRDTLITYPNNVHTDYCSSYSSSSTLKSNQFATAIDFSSLNKPYKHKSIRLTRSKRLNLLWQWGLSTGYCEYSHAKKLNAFIVELQQKYNDSSQQQV